MIARYLTKIEIIRALNLPEKVGRVKFAMWQKEPTFPPVEPATGGRWWFPCVLDWVQRYNSVGAAAASIVSEASASSTGEERWDEWRAKRRGKNAKAKAAGGPEDTRPPVPAKGNALGAAVVATIGPRGARIPQDNVSPLAAERIDRPAT